MRHGSTDGNSRRGDAACKPLATTTTRFNRVRPFDRMNSGSPMVRPFSATKGVGPFAN